jgi:hypothetical protein
VALMEDGKVVAIGTHSELLASEPRYVAALAAGRPERKPVARPKPALSGAAAAALAARGEAGMPPGIVGPGSLGGLGV